MITVIDKISDQTGGMRFSGANEDCGRGRPEVIPESSTRQIIVHHEQSSEQTPTNSGSGGLKYEHYIEFACHKEQPIHV